MYTTQEKKFVCPICKCVYTSYQETWDCNQADLAQLKLVDLEHAAYLSTLTE